MTSSFTAVWIAFLMLAGNIERQHLARTVLAAASLEVGQTASDVASHLGRPLGDYGAYAGWSFLKIGKHPRQWCYGAKIDLDSVFIADPVVTVNLLPIHIRWLGYRDEDLVIDLDETGCVTRIRMPNLPYEVDNRYDGILNSLYSLSSFAKEIAKK